MGVRNKMKKRNQPLRILAVIVGLFAGYAAISMMREWGREESKTKDVLNKIAFGLNQKLPLMIDAVTRLDLVETGENRSIIFNYSILNKTKSEVDLSAIKLNLQLNFFGMNNSVFDQQTKLLRDHRIDMYFKYKDKNGDLVTEIIFTPKDY